MANILDSIRYLFNKKDEIQNIPTTIANAGNKIISAIGSVKPLPFGPSLAEIKPAGTFDLSQAYDMAKGMAQSIPREVAAIAPTIGEAIGKPFELTPTTVSQKIALGNEPIKSYQQQGRDAQTYVKTLPIPDAIKSPIEKVSPFLPVVGAAIDLSTLGGSKKLTVSTADELATVIKRTLPKVESYVDEASGALHVAYKPISDMLNKIKVVQGLRSNLEAGKIIEGEGYVLRKQGDELIATFDKGFKEVTAPIKTVATKLPEKIQELTTKGTEILDKAKEQAAIAKEKRSMFSQPTIDAINKLKQASRTTAIQEGDIETLRKSVQGPLVEQVTQAVREIPEYANISDEEALRVALDLPNKKELRVPHVPELKEAKKLGEQLKGEVQTFNSETEGLLAPNQTEKEFARQMKEADAVLRQEAPVTPYKHDVMLDKKSADREKGIAKLWEDWNRGYDDTFIGPTTKQVSVLGNSLIARIVDAIPDMKDLSLKNLASANIPDRVFEMVSGGSNKVLSVLRDAVQIPNNVANNDFANFMRSSIKSVQDIIETTGVRGGTPESAAAMDYGEGLLTLDQLKKQLPDTWQGVVKFTEDVRPIFDDLFNKINDVRKAYGLEPVEYRANYFTHALDQSQKVLPAFKNLPTEMALINEYTKPGSKFFQFALQRKGGDYTKDAVYALTQYIPAAGYQIHFTPVIQRERQLASFIANFVEGASKGKEAVLTADHAGEFVSWLAQHSSILAGKNEGLFRLIEKSFTRPAAEVVKTMQSRVSNNLITTIPVALSNLFPVGRTIISNPLRAARAMIGTITDPEFKPATEFTKDGIQSVFLNTRYLSDIGEIYRNPISALNDLLRKPAYLADYFTGQTVFRYKLLEATDAGKSLVEAVKYADSQTNRWLGNRTIGNAPNILKQFPIITSFALEPLNYVASIIHDIPRENQGHAIAGAIAMGQVLVSGYVGNRIYEQFTGHPLAADPLEATRKILEVWLSDDKLDKKFKTTVEQVMGLIPIVQNLAGVGSVPIASAFTKPEQATQDPMGALIKLGMLFSPVGGLSQIYKTYTGLSDYGRGFKQTTDRYIMYPIDQTPMNLIRAVFFGRSSFPESRDYYEQGMRPLGVDQTLVFKNMLANNPDVAQAYYAQQQATRLTVTADEKIKQIQTQLKLIMNDPFVSPDQKNKALDASKRRIMEVNGQTVSEIVTMASRVNTVAQPELISTLKNVLDTKALAPIINGSLFASSKGINLGKIRVPKAKAKKITIKPVKFLVNGKPITSKNKSVGIKPISQPPSADLPTPISLRSLSKTRTPSVRLS